uniref:retropepsin-like aspartic protease family protein n=1 Tax=uncultured Tenacibaculum sp. TaxID=174713 RepID=UPI0026114B27|nr:retropepsin-like aspartic protease [uncultured Tenacibaculum sp.]
MKKYILFLNFILIGHIMSFSQNLSIPETIDYINKNLIKGSKLNLSSDGSLTYELYTKDYISTLTNVKNYLDKIGDYETLDNINSYTSNRKKTAPIKTNIEFNISDLNIIKLHNPNEFTNDVYSRENLMTGKVLFEDRYLKEWALVNEWTIGFECQKDEVYHIRKGDCISVNNGGYKEINHYVGIFKIRSIDGLKKSSEKIRNALLYLIDLAKQNGYETKNTDDDPFASINFNSEKFNIESKQNSDEIKLSSQNGVYHININIGGVFKKFILDSGASDVLISKEFEKELIKKRIIKKEDYLTSGLYRIADGSIIKCRRLILNELKIGGFRLKNVRVTVNSSNTMLLGKSVLDKFKNWSINNLKKTLILEK